MNLIMAFGMAHRSKVRLRKAFLIRVMVQLTCVNIYITPWFDSEMGLINSEYFDQAHIVSYQSKCIMYVSCSKSTQNSNEKAKAIESRINETRI